MLLRLFLALAISTPAWGSGEGDNEEPTIVSNAPEYIARSVFVGPDQEMPTDGRWRISISPTIKDEEIWFPDTISEAFREMGKALPSWYQIALKRSSGSLECFVMVNNVALHSDVMNWLWVHWHLEERESTLRRSLEELGAENKDQVLFGLHDGFCYYLKYGEEKAMELLTSPDSEEWQEREYPPLGSSKNDNP